MQNIAMEAAMYLLKKKHKYILNAINIIHTFDLISAYWKTVRERDSTLGQSAPLHSHATLNAKEHTDSGR